MSTIASGQGVLTFINVFTVEPDRQQQLVDLLTEAAEQTFRHLPGFVSANIHRSLDGHKVVNYAQWRSKADFEAVRANAEAQRHVQAAAAFASFEPVFCEVSSVIEPA
jgi:quinol monooxygenase YgiN